MRFSFVSNLVFVTFVLSQGTIRAQTLRIGAHDRSRNGDLNVADGAVLGDLRASLSEHVTDFGFDEVEIVSFGELTRESLGDARVAIVHNTFDGARSMQGVLSGDEQRELRAFVEEGGSIFVFVDSYRLDPDALAAADAVLEPFDLSLAARSDLSCQTHQPVTDPRRHPVTGGRFGEVRFLESVEPTWFVGVAPTMSEVISAESNGEPLVVAIDRGALAPGSGRVVLVSDANWIGGDEFGLQFPRHEALFLNIMAWLAAPCDPLTTWSRSIMPPAPAAGAFGDFLPGDRVHVALSFGRIRSVDGECGGLVETLLRERLPRGWTVDPDSISLGGVLTNEAPDGERESYTITWRSPESGIPQERGVSYVAIAPEGEAEDAEFSGDLTEVESSTRSVILGESSLHAFKESALRIAALDSSRNGEFNLRDGDFARRMREVLSEEAETLGFDGHDLISLPSLSHERLAEAEVLVLTNRDFDDCGEILSEEETVVLVEFVRAGGSALILVDPYVGSGASFVEPLGVEVGLDWVSRWGEVNAIPSPESHPVTDGPFGRVTQVRTGAPGWFTDLGGVAAPLARLSANGLPLLAAIDRNALAPGSGRVVLSSDYNWIGDDRIPPIDFYFDEHRALFLNTIAWLTERPARVTFIRGDGNDDGAVDLSDSVFVLNWLFLGGAAPVCLAAANTNGDESVDISDATYLLNHLFLGGPVLAAPFPECGVSPLARDEELECGDSPESCR